MMELPAHSQAALPLGSAHLACGHTPLNRTREQGRKVQGIREQGFPGSAPPSAKHTSHGGCAVCATAQVH